MNLQVGGAANWVTGGGNIAVIPMPERRASAWPSVSGQQGVHRHPASLLLPRRPRSIAPVLFTGLGQTSLDGFGDTYTIPVGVGVLVGMNSMFDVGAPLRPAEPDRRHRRAAPTVALADPLAQRPPAVSESVPRETPAPPGPGVSFFRRRRHTDRRASCSRTLVIMRSTF